MLATSLTGILVGAAATRLRGPYLAGVTLAFAIGLPGLALKFSSLFGGDNGLAINPPIPPSGLGSSFPLERWEAWIACAGALVVMFLLYNLLHSGTGRRLRAIRDDEIASSLCGLHVARTQTMAFVISAACAGLGGGVFAVVTQLAAPGAFTLQLSLSLLTAVVVGGLGSLTGAIWGAALLVLLPGMVERHRPLVLADSERLGQPAARYLRSDPDRGDARLAQRGPGGIARARAKT